MQVGIEFWQYKRKMMQAARDLLYGEDVVAQIEQAETDDEITKIMRTARLAGEERDMRR